MINKRNMHLCLNKVDWFIRAVLHELNTHWSGHFYSVSGVGKLSGLLINGITGNGVIVFICDQKVLSFRMNGKVSRPINTFNALSDALEAETRRGVWRFEDDPSTGES